MSKAGDDSRDDAEAPMDRLLRFGRALFAVRKDELEAGKNRRSLRQGEKKGDDQNEVPPDT